MILYRVVHKLCCVCVYQYAGLFFALFAGDLLHFLRERYVGWAAARGGVCVWARGDGLSSNSVCIANSLIFKAYTLQDTVIKKHKFLFKGTRVLKVYMDQEERVCIVCMSQYMKF